MNLLSRTSSPDGVELLRGEGEEWPFLDDLDTGLLG